MQSKKIKVQDINVYTEKLQNGLEIYLVPMTDKKRYYITYATKYGSLITDFTPYKEKKEVKVPNGVAHFLEHKMFEQESGEDPFEFFSKTGTYCNASTGFESTRYICSGTDNYEENLKYLLNFVNTPYFTDKNVEKEKGIIIEELNMYKDDPGSAIDDTCRKAIFQKDHHLVDIGGEVEDVKAITKEDLYLCYNNFYEPKNMFVLIVGNIDIEQTMNILKAELDSRENKYEKMPTIKNIVEPYKVKKEKEVVRFNVEVPKVDYLLKLRRSDFGIKDKYTLDLYLNQILSSIFGTTSLFNEEGKKMDYFSYFFYEFDTTDEYIVINLGAETTKPNELFKYIEKTLQDRMNILNREDFERSKKVNIANKIKNSCYIDSVVGMIYSDLINYNKIIYDKLDIIRNIDYNRMLEIAKKIDISNKSLVCYIPKNYPKFDINY